MLCEPVSLGFNVGDVQVMNHLPSICVNLLKALKKAPCRDMLETHLKEKVTAQRWALGHAHGYCELGPHLSLCPGVPDSRVHNCSALKETCQCLCVLMCVRVHLCVHTQMISYTFWKSWPSLIPFLPVGWERTVNVLHLLFYEPFSGVTFVFSRTMLMNLRAKWLVKLW